ncbi:MAG: hypothetical protein JJT96_00525 [Opitutales bacterium]|nr:hypothetical protein [Opitutales bacterium]
MNSPIRYSNFRSNYSPFAVPAFREKLAECGFLQSSLWHADVVFCRHRKAASVAARLFPFKQVVIWTHEPGYDETDRLRVRFWPGRTTLVCNVFTGNVFWHNAHFLGSYHYDTRVDLGLPLVELNPSAIANAGEFSRRRGGLAVFAKKNTEEERRIGGVDIDLNEKRQHIAEVGHSLGECVIVGQGWGEKAMEASGWESGKEEPWWTRKLSLLRDVRFSIALENTLWPHYVTEKIWHAIVAGALPVYWGRGSSIYESFDRESFVDAADYPTPEALWNGLSTMACEEWCARMSRCVEGFNRAVRQRAAGPHPLEEVVGRLASLLK